MEDGPRVSRIPPPTHTHKLACQNSFHLLFTQLQYKVPTAASPSVYKTFTLSEPCPNCPWTVWLQVFVLGIQSTLDSIYQLFEG